MQCNLLLIILSLQQKFIRKKNGFDLNKIKIIQELNITIQSI